jgi:hypothetical protein
MLIGAVPQLVSAVRLVVNQDGLDPEVVRVRSPGGYLLGTLVGLVLAALLVRFGVRKFKQGVNKTIEPTR